MPEFNQVELQTKYEGYKVIREEILDDLKKLVVESKATLEGNSFYIHASLNLYPALYTKQVNLFWCGMQATTKICEIGFNAGHSTMLLLLGRDSSPIDFTIFDIGHHAYTKPCVEYMKKRFSNVAFEYVEGDSERTMPAWILDNTSARGTYDVVHVDGGHFESCIMNDMKYTDILVRVGGIVIVDDTNSNIINRYVDMYLGSGKYKELDTLKTYGYPHRIIQKIM